MTNQCIIGIDIGGTHSRIGSIAMDGTLLHSMITSSKTIADGSPETAISDLADYIRAYIDTYVTNPVAGIAIAFPGTLDAKRKILYSASNLGKDGKCRFDGMHVADELMKILRIPVYLGKDADFILYHDVHELGIETEELVTGIYFGTGIGCSFMYKGETIYGYNGVTGEIGHLPISDNKRPCTCGKTQGCCETVASGWRLTQIRDQYFPDTPMSELFVRHAETEELKEYVNAMARVIALTSNLLNSAYTILGGGIVNMEGFPRARLEAETLSMLRSPYPHNGFRLLFSKNGQNAGVLGAAQFLFRKLNQ